MDRASSAIPVAGTAHALLVGEAGPVADAIAKGIEAVAGSVQRTGWRDLPPLSRERGAAAPILVFVPPMPPPAPVDAVEVETLSDLLDEVFVGAAEEVRACLGGMPAGGRVLFVVGWSAFGLAEDCAAALAAGGASGLARSWSSELEDLGVTANVVVLGPDETDEVLGGLRHAVSFFLDPSAAAISGQVLVIAGSATTGMLPI